MRPNKKILAMMFFHYSGSLKTLLFLALLLTTAFAKPSLDFQWADFMERFEEEKNG